MSPFIRGGCVLVLAIAISVALRPSRIALEAQGAAQAVSPALRWQPEPAFSTFIRQRFADFKDSSLAFERAVSVIAVPTQNTPVETMDALRPGRIIGALYLSTGSTRLNLGPGSYSIRVLMVGDQWRAQLLDGGGKVVTTIPAQVSVAAPVPFPVAYVDQSVCYRFDNTLVCV